MVTDIPITRGGARSNHLFFVDDNLVFCKANIFEWGKMQKPCIEVGLNRENTSIFFSKNTKTEAK
jgi:hypothetical protein